MPYYDYYCEENGETVEVHHSMKEKLHTWGEVCFRAQHPLGETDATAEVRIVIRAPGIAFPVGNSRLKEHGFTKLVKRDDGVYENMTATNDESRYMKAGDPSTMPDIKRKIGD